MWIRRRGDVFSGPSGFSFSMAGEFGHSQHRNCCLPHIFPLRFNSTVFGEARKFSPMGRVPADTLNEVCGSLYRRRQQLCRPCRKDANSGVSIVAKIGARRSGDVNFFAIVSDFAFQDVGKRISWPKQAMIGKVRTDTILQGWRFKRCTAA